MIKKEDDKLVIENPGSIRTGKKQMFRGGIPDIYQVWENEGWPMPVVEESYNPGRTRALLSDMTDVVVEGANNLNCSVVCIIIMWFGYRREPYISAVRGENSYD